MKKIILLALTALIMVGCEYKNNFEIEEAKRLNGFNIVVIDSCEYLEKCEAYGYQGYGYFAHKGNCRFCAERRKQELKDKPAASFFPQTKLVDRYKKEGCLYIPETDVSTLPANRYSKAFGVFGVNLCTICSGYVSTVDVPITSFLQSSVQPKHLLSALASQCFPLTGALHLTRVQLKTQSYRLLWAVLSRWRKRVVVMVSHRKEGCYTTRLRCKVS